jgi:hypothetical protein
MRRPRPLFQRFLKRARICKNAGGTVQRFLISAVLFALILPPTALKAFDISGTWQGAIKGQYVLKISRSSGSGYRGKWYILGQPPRISYRQAPKKQGPG